MFSNNVCIISIYIYIYIYKKPDLFLESKCEPVGYFEYCSFPMRGDGLSHASLWRPCWNRSRLGPSCRVRPVLMTSSVCDRGSAPFVYQRFLCVSFYHSRSHSVSVFDSHPNIFLHAFAHFEFRSHPRHFPLLPKTPPPPPPAPPGS